LLDTASEPGRAEFAAIAKMAAGVTRSKASSAK